MELRLPAAKLDEQAIKLAVCCGEREWKNLDAWRKNVYRKMVVSFITGCGVSVVLVDASDDTRGSNDTSVTPKTPQGRAETPQNA